MTTFNFVSANGATNYNVVTDLIGPSDGSENLTVCAKNGTDTLTQSVLTNLLHKQTTVGALKTIASDYNLKLSSTEQKVGASTQTHESIALVAPSALVATVVSATRIDLAWTDATNEDVEYILERATNAGFTTGFAVVYTGPLKEYSNTGLTTATHYYYRVRAIGTYADDSTNASDDDTTS